MIGLAPGGQALQCLKLCEKLKTKLVSLLEPAKVAKNKAETKLKSAKLAQRAKAAAADDQLALNQRLEQRQGHNGRATGKSK